MLRIAVFSNTTIISKLATKYEMALVYMKYTAYFRPHLKANACPHLNADRFALYMNIVHLEGRAQLNDLANKAAQNDQKFVCRLKVDAIERRINKLTSRMEPKGVLNSLVENSEI